MNRPITRLYGLVALLFALLIAFTSRWTVFEASSLRENPRNNRTLLLRERVDRGPIVSAGGAVLARSVRTREGTYERVYPFGSLFAAALGYSNVIRGSTGLERYRNRELEGEQGESLQSILDQVQGKRRTGEKVLTTLDTRAQQVAQAALAGHEGAVVALEPHTGAVEVMASSPSYDPNDLRTRTGTEHLTRETAGAHPRQSLLNRALQFGYAPGSTFKIVTATAAIDSGDYTPSSTVNGRNGVLISGLPLENDQGQSFGDITLTQALAQSVNTVWAQVAEHVGRHTLQRYMERFGFGALPQLDYPPAEMSASGEYRGSTLIPVTSPEVDVGRLGIGQDKLEVTPMQMAEVAAAVADHGTLMAPHLTQRVVDSEGQTVVSVSPRAQSVVMRPSTAAAVTGMMEAVVNEGTGTPAKIPGIQVAGKTGTAETQHGTAINNVWFIAFAPASNPRVAIAATLKAVPGFGAAFAAPIARQVMEALLG